MRQAQGLLGLDENEDAQLTTESAGNVALRDSGIVPARSPRARAQILRVATELTPPRPEVRQFGATLAGAGNVLLVSGRLNDHLPYAAFYRLRDVGAVRERTFRGADGHAGPALATDGLRIAVGQSAPEGSQGIASVYVQSGDELALEAKLPSRHEVPPDAGFGDGVALGGDLLAVGHGASVSVYRHSAVGWLLAGTPAFNLPYAWNPRLGCALAVIAGRVLVANPVEVDGHRAGPGRVFVYRQRPQGSELESVLSGDGIEAGREEAFNLGFGSHVQVAGEFAVITAPFELTGEGRVQSRVYIYRAQSGTLNRVASLAVPSCQYGACLIGDRLCVLGDELYVFARRGHTLEPLAIYDARGARSIAACGGLIALARTREQTVSLHFAAQL